MERLDDLMLFAEVVQETGFAAAARSLGMQRSRVSRRVADLESRLGVRLLQRNTRCLSLTTAGERIYQHARVIADEARAASLVANELHGEPRGTLRLTCPASFAVAALIPLVDEFCRLYPEVEILLDTRFSQPDLVAEGFELAFRIQIPPLEDSSLVARQIGEVGMTTVVSPALLAKNGPLTHLTHLTHSTHLTRLMHPEQLRSMKLLAHASQSGPKCMQFFNQDLRECLIEYAPRLSSDNMAVLQAAAIAGMGAICLPDYLCRDALRGGQLVDAIDPAGGWRPAPANIYALMPARTGVTLTTRVFLDFAISRLPRVLNPR